MQTIVGVAILLTSLAGIVTSIALLWVKVIRPFSRFCRRIGKVVDSMHDLPEWQASVDEALCELRPNGGGSMKDKVNNTHKLIKEHTQDKRCHADQHGPLND